MDMLLPLSKLQNHTQFCADLGEQVKGSRHRYFKFVIEAEQGLQHHRFIPGHRSILSEYPQLRRVRDIVGKWNVMNVDHDSGVQTRKHLQIEKWDIANDPQDMAGVDKQNVV